MKSDYESGGQNFESTERANSLIVRPYLAIEDLPGSSIAIQFQAAAMASIDGPSALQHIYLSVSLQISLASCQFHNSNNSDHN